MTDVKTSFSDEVKRIADEVMSDGTVDAILRDNITEGIKRAIDNSFEWGDLKHAISDRVTEVMVPYIKGYNMSSYVVKLDEVLNQIIDQTVLVDNKQLLSNFKSLMIEPDEKVISLEKLFDSYTKLVSEHADTSGLDIEDGAYEPVESYAEISMQDDSHLSKYALLKFWAEEQDDLSFAVRLQRWKDEKREGYTISYDVKPDIESIRFMNDFELLLTRLSRCSARVTWIDESLVESVELEQKPELTYV